MKVKGMGITFDDVLLVPQKSSIASRDDVILETHLTPKIRLAVPLVSANMDTVTESGIAIEVAKVGGIGIIHRFLTIKREVEEVSLVKAEGFLVGAAIGIKEDHMERASALIDAGCDVLIIDIAHGHSIFLLKVLENLKKKFKKTEIISVNIATSLAAKDLIEAGADAIKVGIGPGAMCSTRIVAGAGVPQLTAIADCAAIASKHNIPVIADGGIRYSSDIVKALGAGASTVMIGTLLAGCKESPSTAFFQNGEKYKLVRGMASLHASQERQKVTKDIAKKDLSNYTEEGVSAVVRYKGSAEPVLLQLIGGMRSGFSYSGARNIAELWKKAEFIQISRNGLTESHPRMEG